jgi:hypothetical protein
MEEDYADLIERLCLDLDPEVHHPEDYYNKERLEAAEAIETLLTLLKGNQA